MSIFPKISFLRVFISKQLQKSSEKGKGGRQRERNNSLGKRKKRCLGIDVAYGVCLLSNKTRLIVPRMILQMWYCLINSSWFLDIVVCLKWLFHENWWFQGCVRCHLKKGVLCSVEGASLFAPFNSVSLIPELGLAHSSLSKIVKWIN